MLKFPIREMKKRSKREMGLIHIGREVKLGMSLGASLGRQNIRFPFSEKNQSNAPLLFYLFVSFLLNVTPCFWTISML